mgnify:CR=1 FL=1
MTGRRQIEESNVHLCLYCYELIHVVRYSNHRSIWSRVFSLVLSSLDIDLNAIQQDLLGVVYSWEKSKQDNSDNFSDTLLKWSSTDTLPQGKVVANLVCFYRCWYGEHDLKVINLARRSWHCDTSCSISSFHFLQSRHVQYTLWESAIS